MRTLFLNDVPLDLADGGEYPDVGLCCPDDPPDKVLNYVLALDDGYGFLEALGIEPDDHGSQGAGVSKNDAQDMGVGAVVPGENTGARNLSADVPAPPPTMGFDFGAALDGGKTSAHHLFGGVPELVSPPTMADMGFGTGAAADGFVYNAPALARWPAHALSYSSSTVSSTTSSCMSSGETESPEHGSLLMSAWTVPRKRRCRPAVVRKRPCSLAFPNVLASATAQESHGENNANVSNGRRRSVGPLINQKGQGTRTCTHCMSSETPQWRAGPKGPGTLCNACSLRYNMGKLYDEYRPSMSPFFRNGEHSNRHRKVEKPREKKLKTLASMGAGKEVIGQVLRVNTSAAQLAS